MASLDIGERRVTWRRLLAGGLSAMFLVAAAGRALEFGRFGRSDAAAIAHANARIRQQFADMVQEVSAISARIAASPAIAEAIGAGPDDARVLFDIAASERRASAAPRDIAITLYDAGIVARAWAGAPSDIPDERIAGPSALFVTPSPLGLRLVHVQPVLAGDRRVATVATEHVLSPAPAALSIGPANYVLPTPLVPATLRTRVEGAGEQPRPGAVLLEAPSGDPLAEAWVDPEAVAAARTGWRRGVRAAVVAAAGVTVLLFVGPLLDRRARAVEHVHGAATAPRSGGLYVRTTAAAVGLTVAGSLLLAVACAIRWGPPRRDAALLLIAGAMAAAIVALLVGPIARLRAAIRTRRVFASGRMTALVAAQLVASGMLVVAIVGFARGLESAIGPVPVDLRQFSLHPWRADRLMLLTGIVAAHLALIWGGTLLLSAAIARWRLSRRLTGLGLAVLGLWIAPAIALVLWVPWSVRHVPATGLLLSVAACGLTALSASRLAAWYRRATVAARIFALFLAFLCPTLLLYPLMDDFAERAIRHLIETEYAIQAQNHVQTLLDRMEEAQAQVDALEELPSLVRGEDIPPDAPAVDAAFLAAFLVWRQTALARERLTSAVELYDPSGALVSRFPFNLPQYTTGGLQSTPNCDWDVFVEVASIGPEERPMLHAERHVCLPDEQGRLTPQGGIIMHVVPEYETLPFISSQNPYLEVFRAGAEREEGTPGGHVEVAIYGWGLQPLYTSGRSAWPITDQLFAELYRSRDPFWAEVRNGGDWHHIYFSNDRQRIFAIGYRRLSLFDHFVHLAEFTTFGGAAFLLVLLGTAAFTRVARARPRVGRALLREIRASFYRKLVLAFVLAAIVPVLALALVIRAYVETLLRADIEAEATRTAAIAQRVIEEADAPLRRTAGGLGTLNDDVMVWISQVIDQDVNVFQGARLVATSERNLFASGVLPTRTPDDVYRAIVLQRLPSFVRPDSIGGFSYMLAAAPVRVAGEDALVTVPLALRQREIEREIDELDRGVHLAALVFVLVGAGIGLSMAERIADPIRRLTRATGRIARGDFDARIAVRSVDELRRLVDSFNSMAAELKAQRRELERTHRLEAWAEMARQVAHEIKNPLTPIQLSAEHLRRVHADRGEPMGPVLEGCVASILGQVRLLRQISAEFSSFASSPTAKPAAVDLTELVSEVVDPYRTGLAGRIQIDNRVPPSLPPVLVDRTLVARAFSNIIENALHAMPGTGRLTLDARVEPGHVAVSVGDTGAGMDDEALERVFEPYFSTKTTGTGLGLPIARRNIELNGGTIEVISAKGVGTTVIVRLPRAEIGRS